MVQSVSVTSRLSSEILTDRMVRCQIHSPVIPHLHGSTQVRGNYRFLSAGGVPVASRPSSP